MIDYRVDVRNGCFRIEGNILPGSKAVKIPTNTVKQRKLQQQFVSLFLNKADIEAGIDYLNCISLNNHIRANEALFVAALSVYYKCFQNSGARIALNEAAFKHFSPQFSDEYDRFKNWRNKHYIHDENSMIQTCAFLLVAPVDSQEKFGGPPSVVWNKVSVDYLREGRILYNMMQETWRFIIKRIDEIGDFILGECVKFSREELLTLDEVQIEIATPDHPEQKRG